jgi:hypothetical protein
LPRILDKRMEAVRGNEPIAAFRQDGNRGVRQVKRRELGKAV